jgi:hypothetical protein
MLVEYNFTEPQRPSDRDVDKSGASSGSESQQSEPTVAFRNQPLANTADPITGTQRLRSGGGIRQEKTAVDFADDAASFVADSLNVIFEVSRWLAGARPVVIQRFIMRETTAKRLAIFVIITITWTYFEALLRLLEVNLTTDETSFLSDTRRIIRLHQDGCFKINFLARPLGEERYGHTDVGCGNKTFFVGPHRTGTDSINKMFYFYVGEYGYRTLHDFTWRKGDREVLKEHDIFTGGCNHDVGSILAACPAAKYVYQTRNLRDWLASNLAWAFAQRHYFFKAKYRKVPWLVRKMILPRLYNIADEMVHGCGVPTFSKASARKLLHQRFFREAQLGRLFPVVLSAAENRVLPSPEKGSNDASKGPRLLVWETSYSITKWRSLFDFVNHSSNEREDERHLQDPYVWDLFARFDNGGMNRPGGPPMTAYRCIKYAAGRLADAVLKSEAEGIAKHCDRWPQFCSGGVLIHDHLEHDSDLMAVAERMSQKFRDDVVWKTCHRMHDYMEDFHDEVDPNLKNYEILDALARGHGVTVLPGAIEVPSEQAKASATDDPHHQLGVPLMHRYRH